jgi:hypothetical protein
MHTPPPTSTAAILSLVFGIVSWVALPFVGAVVAVIAGHIARGDIRRAGGRLDGDGLAVAGLVLGWVQLALIAFGIAAAFLFFGGLTALFLLAA